MGKVPQYEELPNLPTQDPNDNMVVAPFAADIDTTNAGSVIYTRFPIIDKAQLNSVNSFIHSQTNAYGFSGDRLLVAEWNRVSKKQLLVRDTLVHIIIIIPIALCFCAGNY